MKLVVLALIVLGLSACQFPADTDGTLDRVRGHVLRVGVAEAEPFVEIPDSGPPQGVEVELVERFAQRLDADVKWVTGSESDLIEALHGRQLDIVIAGFTRHTPWQTEVAITRPYLTTKTVIAAPDEETAVALSEDLEGREIAAEEGTAAAGKLYEDTDASVTLVEDIATHDGPVAVEDFLVDDLGYVPTDAELTEDEHAMAVSAGENAFMVELERFLLDNEQTARDILQREGTP